MKILLKDSALVDAVIKKITDRHLCFMDGYMKYCVPTIKEIVGENNPVILEVDYEWNQKHQCMESVFCHCQVSDIPTDTDFLNDKEW